MYSSFGQTAIFLLGGQTIEDKTTALFLKSGDVLVMSSESRLAYHGVPKILKTNEQVWNEVDEVDERNVTTEDMELYMNDKKWEPFDDYLGHSRINMNVRQVLRRGQKRLTSELSTVNG